MSNWTDELAVGSIVMSAGNIVVKVAPDTWYESVITEGYHANGESVADAFKMIDVVYAPDIVSDSAAGTILEVSDGGALYKLGEDQWVLTGEPKVLTDDQVRNIGGLRKVGN